MSSPVPFNNGSEADAPQTMVYTVDLGDGRVAEVEGPPNATPDQLHAIVSGGQPDAAPELVGSPDQAQQTDANPLSPEDETALRGLYHTGTADQIQAFLHARGRMSDPATVADYIAKRDAGKPVADNPNYAGQAVDPSNDWRAFARGGAQGLLLGHADETHGFLNGVVSMLSGDGYTKGYNDTVNRDRALDGSDREHNFGLSLAGNLVGGALLPMGLAKAGLTPTLEAVALRAGQEAVAAGATADAAKVIAARAVARRMAAEGLAYGAGYGEGDAEGGVGERLRGAALGGATGALLGGLGVPLAGRAVSGLAKGAGSAFEAATGGFTEAGARRKAGDLISGNAVRPIEDVLNDIANRPEAVPGSRPTLGEVANDAGLAGLQRGIANSSTNAELGERFAQNAIARTRYADEVLGTGNPQAVQDVASERLASAQADTALQQAARARGVEQRLADLRDQAGNDRAAAAQAVEAGRAAIGQAVDRTATGSSAREAFSDAYAAARARTREAYSAPVLKAETPVSIGKPVFESILSDAHEFYGNGGGEIPAELQSILSDAADNPTTTRTLTNLDQRLADFAGSQRMSGRNKAAAFADSVRDRIAAVAHDQATPEYRAALSSAKAVRREQGRVFETGDAAKAFAIDKFGNPTVGDTQLPASLSRPGPPGGDTADGLIAAIGPERAETVMRQELRRVAEEGGVQTHAQARSLATRYGEAAKRFPALQSDLSALVDHAGRLDAAASAARDADRATMTTAERAHINEISAAEQAIKASPLRRIANQDEDPASFVSKLLGRSDGGRMLKRLASDVSDNPDAVAGLRRSFGQYIVEAGSGVRNTAAGDDIPALAKTRKAISTIITRSGDLLTPQQKIALQRVGRELKATNFAMNAGRPSGSDTAQNQSYKAALHFLPAAIPHVGGAKAVLSVLASHFTNREQVQHLLTQAILDPDFAATLLKRPTGAHLDAARNRLLGRKALISSSVIAQKPEQVVLDKAVGQ